MKNGVAKMLSTVAQPTEERYALPRYRSDWASSPRKTYLRTRPFTQLAGARTYPRSSRGTE